jgi:hypothetical protein
LRKCPAFFSCLFDTMAPEVQKKIPPLRTLYKYLFEAKGKYSFRTGF